MHAAYRPRRSVDLTTLADMLDRDIGMTRAVILGGQTHLAISLSHAEAAQVEATCRESATFFDTLRRTVEQLTPR